MDFFRSLLPILCPWVTVFIHSSGRLKSYYPERIFQKEEESPDKGCRSVWPDKCVYRRLNAATSQLFPSWLLDGKQPGYLPSEQIIKTFFWRIWSVKGETNRATDISCPTNDLVRSSHSETWNQQVSPMCSKLQIYFVSHLNKRRQSMINKHLSKTSNRNDKDQNQQADESSKRKEK